MDTIAGICLIAGSLLTLLAALGVVRFPDTYSRMHAAAKGPVLGIMLIAVGVGLSVRTTEATVVSLLVVIVQLITAPVGTHLIARSIYRRLGIQLDDVDELAMAESIEPHDQDR